MRFTPGIICLLLCSFTHGEGKHDAWKWEQAVEVSSIGLCRIHLPPETLNASSASLGDIRLISPEGKETPYVLDRTQQPPQGVQAATDFKASMEDDMTVLTARTQTDQPIGAITLKSPANDFIKAATIETRKLGGDWKTVVENEVIFRQPNGVNRLKIPIDQTGFFDIRITIDNRKSPPVPFTGIGLTLKGIDLPTTSHPAVVAKRSERKNKTLLKIDLGSRNLNLASLHLDVAEPVFSRAYRLYDRGPSHSESHAKKLLADGSIYSVHLDQKSDTSQRSIPVHRIIPDSFVYLEIVNGDSPPLTIDRSVQAGTHPTSLIFHAPQTGTWTLITGYPEIQAPRYDLASLIQQLSNPAHNLKPGPIRENPNYVKPELLPEISPSGTVINLNDWSHRRPIEAPEYGLIQLQLDPATLAHTRGDLADIRIVQNDHQLPYLVESSNQTQSIRPSIDDANDPEHPKLSRWKITLPHDHLPATRLIATSDTPIFDRHIKLTSEGKDGYGNRILRTLASGRWQKDLNDPSTATFSLSLKQQRLPKSVYLETVNGDNPPISLTQVDIVCPKPSIIFKRVQADTVHLYYGNPEAASPRYDLNLIRVELESATKQMALTGDAEIIHPMRDKNGSINTGSPWLWAALGVCVLTLLIVVAKLLPKPRDEAP